MCWNSISVKMLKKLFQRQATKKKDGGKTDGDRTRENRKLELGHKTGFPTVPQMESSARGHCLLGAARMLTLFSAMTVSFREACTRLSGAKAPQSQPAFSPCAARLSNQTILVL